MNWKSLVLISLAYYSVGCGPEVVKNRTEGTVAPNAKDEPRDDNVLGTGAPVDPGAPATVGTLAADVVLQLAGDIDVVGKNKAGDILLTKANGEASLIKKSTGELRNLDPAEAPPEGAIRLNIDGGSWLITAESVTADISEESSIDGKATRTTFLTQELFKNEKGLPDAILGVSNHVLIFMKGASVFIISAENGQANVKEASWPAQLSEKGYSPLSGNQIDSSSFWFASKTRLHTVTIADEDGASVSKWKDQALDLPGMEGELEKLYLEPALGEEGLDMNASMVVAKTTSGVFTSKPITEAEVEVALTFADVSEAINNACVGCHGADSPNKISDINLEATWLDPTNWDRLEQSMKGEGKDIMPPFPNVTAEDPLNKLLIDYIQDLREAASKIDETPQVQLLTFADIETTVTQNCAGCHGADADVTTYKIAGLHDEAGWSNPATYQVLIDSLKGESGKRLMPIGGSATSDVNKLLLKWIDQKKSTDAGGM